MREISNTIHPSSLTHSRRRSGFPLSETPWFRPSALPMLFGGACYCLIVHQYIPGLLTPVTKKKGFTQLVLGVYGSIVSYYLIMCWLAVVAFAEVTANTCSPHWFHPCRLQSMITFNFGPCKQGCGFSFSLSVCYGVQTHTISRLPSPTRFVCWFWCVLRSLPFQAHFPSGWLNMPWLINLIMILPLFSLASSFPLIAITLRKNLAVWCDVMGIMKGQETKQRYVLGLIAGVSMGGVEWGGWGGG
jgi:hypothetical protein